MTRNTHDRIYDHHGPDLDSNIDLDGATASYADGDDLHVVVSDLDDRIGTIESTPAPPGARST